MGTPELQAATSPGAAYAVSIRQAADMVGLSETTIRDAVNKQHLPAKKIGRVIRVRVADLTAWFDSLDDAREAS